MKTCLIFGHNGLDMDVVLNVRSLYKDLGYFTVYDTKLVNASILVILRAVDSPIYNFDKYNFQQVHIYDYGGWNYDECIKSINHKNIFIFTTSLTHKQHLSEDLNFPKEKIFISLPPVDTKLWIKPKSDPKFDLIHIGNCKFKVVDDLFQTRFNTYIYCNNIPIWGQNWEKINVKSKGAAGLFAVSKIYSKSRFALGIMVPFQRDVTFSGRFWHATLNGCYLISEPGLYTAIIPGVIESDFTDESIKKILDDNNKYNQDILRRTAKEFWNNEYKKIQEKLSQILPQTNTLEKSWRNYLILFNNILKEFYAYLKSLLTNLK